MTRTLQTIHGTTVMSLAKWLLVLPVAMWWAAIFIIQLLNPWVFQPMFGMTLIVVDVPEDIWIEAKWIIAYVIAGEIANNGIDAYKNGESNAVH